MLASRVDTTSIARRAKFSMTVQLLQRLLRPLTTHQLERNTISLHLYLPASSIFLVEQSGFWINLKTAQFLMLNINDSIFLDDFTFPRAWKRDCDCKNSTKHLWDQRTLKTFRSVIKWLKTHYAFGTKQTIHGVHLGITRSSTVPVG